MGDCFLYLQPKLVTTRLLLFTVHIYIFLLLQQDKAEGIALWVSTSLWGNRMDLSLWPATTSNKPIDNKGSGAPAMNLDVISKSKDNLLCDDLNDVIKLLLSDMPGRSRVDIVVDNAGFEVRNPWDSWMHACLHLPRQFCCLFVCFDCISIYILPSIPSKSSSLICAWRIT